MKSKTSFLFIFSLIILITINTESISAQNLDRLSDYSIKLSITPPNVEAGPENHPVGFVYIVNNDGIPITSDSSVDVYLNSDDSDIAAVPDKITIPSGAEYGRFYITTGILTGETVISATLKDKTDFEKIRVGVDESYLPDDAILQLNFPTDKMHINSAMPFSVYFKTSDGMIVRAPYDIEINLEYEQSMATPNSDILVIEKGSYYAWGLLETHKNVGNTFLRAINEDTELDVAKSVSISSTLPASIQLSVFPKMVPAEVEREIDIFVSLVDSEGNPTVAHKDIVLELFSNTQYPVGEELDEIMRFQKPMIKKGEFGYHLKQKFNLQNTLKNDIMIGASSKGFGTATDNFRTVGTSIEMGDTVKRTMNDKVDFGFDVKDYDNTVQVFSLDKIPSNSTTVFVYQMSIVEDDEDDDGVAPNGSNVKVHPDCADKSYNDNDLTVRSDGGNEIERNMDLELEDRILYTVDCLDDEGLYPIQSSEDQYGDGYIKRLNVVSSNELLAKVIDTGNIKKSYSYGTATVTTGQQSGDVVLSASISGVGTASFTTNVVNTLEQKEVKIFSPVGNDVILFDNNGNFDVFIVALDGSKRPKIMKEDSKYLLTPTNGLLEIKKDTTFAYATLRSDSFSTEKHGSVDLTVVPIGEDTDSKMSSTASFTTQPSSMIRVMMPSENLNSDHAEQIGIVQIVDMQGNPIKISKELKTKIFSKNPEIIQILDDAIIPQGQSYSAFPIVTTGSLGTAMISATAKGVVGSDVGLTTSSSLTQLKIFTSGLPDEIPAYEEIEIQLFVDDENAQSVENASIKIKSDEHSVVTPDEIRTGPGGGAKFSLTANNGPTISLDIIATAEGYTPGEQSLLINVDAPEESLTVMDVALPEWVVYLVIAAILMIVAIVVLFLKKSQAPDEEDWEEEEI